MDEQNTEQERPLRARSRWHSFRCAMQGLGYLFGTQWNARLELAAVAAVAAAGFGFDIAAWEWVAVTLACGLVLVAEALNTALEELTNLVSPQWHQLAGRAKDLGAAAVLLSVIAAAVVGGVVFFPRLFSLFLQ